MMVIKDMFDFGLFDFGLFDFALFDFRLFNFKMFDFNLDLTINRLINNKKEFIHDKKGFFSFLDGILAIFILFMGLLIFNAVLDFYNPSISEERHDFKIANDAMELMSLKLDEDNYSILESVIFLIETSNNGYNDYQTKERISAILESSLNDTIPGNDYLLVENNILNGIAIASRGDINTARDVSSATRNIGNYSFTLFVF